MQHKQAATTAKLQRYVRHTKVFRKCHTARYYSHRPTNAALHQFTYNTDSTAGSPDFIVRLCTLTGRIAAREPVNALSYHIVEPPASPFVSEGSGGTGPSLLCHGHHNDGGYEYEQARDKHSGSLASAAAPLFQYDAPDVAEYHVERHQDAP